MSLWKRLFRRTQQPPAETESRLEASDERAVSLPTEPYVFECRQCGKVFEKRRRRPVCPECDSPDVELLSE